MDILKKLSKYFIITLAIMFVCSFVVLVDKFHKIEYDVFDVLETDKALKYFFILGVTAFTASVVNSIGIAALFAFNKQKVQTWKEFVCKLWEPDYCLSFRCPLWSIIATGSSIPK